MPDAKIEIIQENGRFVMQQEEGGITHVLFSDKDGSRAGQQWWLDARTFNLPERLKMCGCTEVQIQQVLESLTSGKDTHLVLDIHRDIPARWL